jgi:cysteine-rich repeat protein
VRWLIALLLIGCVQTNTRLCGDGRICPEGRLCDDIHGMCVSQDQLDQCAAKPDRTRCVSDVTTGQCDHGVCIPGCGDGVQQAGETCDDGSFANHDGCSSVCELEVGSWREVPKPWAARSGHAAAYDSARQVLVVFGGLAQVSANADAGGANDTWERSATGTWRRIDIASPPPARQAAMMAYDASRGIVVMFGGASSAGVVYNDTWEYDGASWTQRSPVASPSSRRLAGMTYDSTRQRIVLFGGGSETLQPFGDVWEYDGATWMQRTTTGTPPTSRYAMAIAYDDSRDRLVMFSGSRLDKETWELAPDGSWSLVSNGTGPKERFAAAMTYDPIGQRVLLFGGDDIGGALNDFWAWNGTTWTMLSSPRTPAPRRFHTLTSVDTSAVLVAGTANNADEPLDDVWTYNDASSWRLENLELTPAPRSSAPFAYDAVRDELVLYGGFLLYNDTWTFDGARWHVKTTPQTAGLRNNHSTAWDAARARVVIYGGLAGGTIAPYDDAWAWDGTRWTRIQTVARPPGRAAAAMAGNAAGVIVMFGGGTAIDGSAALLDTWELEGSLWRKIETAARPAAVFGSAMTYDPVRDRMVLYDSVGDTWTYRDGAWTLLVAGSAPGPRNLTTLVYHEARARVVLYGGTIGTTVLTDMWELDGTTWRRVNTASEPPAATSSSIAYHRTRRSIVLFGGARSNALDETWAFRHESALPDEACTGGLDDDEDGLIDCDDPDCIYAACPN